MKKPRFNLVAAGLCIAGLFTGILNVAQAQTTAFTPPVLNAFGDEPTGNDGLFFTPTTAISVTALGYVIPGSIAGNAVGLYDVSTSTLLASSTITSSSILSGDFLYNLITPISLTAGNEYAVVGLYTAGNGAIGYTADSGVGAAPEITFDGYSYDNNGTLDLPTISYSPPIFGPNFQYTVTPVPEPTTAGCFLLGLGTLACCRRFKRQNERV
jgi:hypothetical protein